MDEVVFEKVNEFQFLETVSSAKNDRSREIKLRITKAESASLLTVGEFYEIGIFLKTKTRPRTTI